MKRRGKRAAMISATLPMLTLEEQILVSRQTLADDAAGGQHHEQADAQQRQNDGRQPPVHGAGSLRRTGRGAERVPGGTASGSGAEKGRSRHVGHIQFSSPTARLKSSPRSR